MVNYIKVNVQEEFPLEIKKILLYLWNFLTNKVIQQWKELGEDDMKTPSNRFLRG